jgi:membrane protease subunit (stomatin/prohibitin family)
MGIWDKLRHELIDIIEWIPAESPDVMVWRFPRYQNEIKYGAKLIVRESQVAAFVNEGKIADVYGPGTYTLTTQNMPILATLRGWKYGFESPFKAEVYFVSTRTFTDRKWGTKNPIMLRDAEFGPLRLRAFGNFQVKVGDPAAFLRQFTGTDAHFSAEQVEEQLRDMVVARFTDVLGESKIPALDLASNYDELGKFIQQRIEPDFNALGLTIPRLFVENISLPAEVEQALDKRTSMGVIGNLNAYTQYQVANSIPDAAKNPGGLGAIGASIGIGAAMGNSVGQAMGQQATGGPPPVPGQANAFFVAVDGKQSGPHEVGKLPELVAGGQLTRQTLVWKPGMVQWTAAGSVQELGGLFANVPPPIPGGGG